MLQKKTELGTMFKIKGVARASIWYMCQQYSLEESWQKGVFLFTMGVDQIFCHFGYIVILSYKLTGFYGNLMPQNPIIMPERNTI